MSEASQLMRRGTTDFVVWTEGHCFLCLSEISSEPELESATYSIQYLAHYLRMDMRKVLREEVHLSQSLLSKLAGSKLKAGLCERCAPMNERFSELYGQLERIRMEVKYCLGEIHGRLTLTQAELTEQKFNENSMDLVLNSEIAGALRKHTIEKCSLKLQQTRPRVILRNIKTETSEELNVRAEESPVTTHGTGGLETGTGSSFTVKEENFSSSDLEEDSASSDSDSDPEEGPTPNYDDDPVDDVKCDISQSQVEDLSSHQDTAHFQVKQEEVDEVTVEESKPVIVRHHNRFNAMEVGNRFKKKLKFTPLRKSSDQDDEYECPYCVKTFDHESKLYRHQREDHLIKYRCRTCKMVANSRLNIRSHQLAPESGCRWGSDDVEVVMPIKKENENCSISSAKQGKKVKMFKDEGC